MSQTVTLSLTVDVAKIAAGLDVDIVCSEKERTALAAAHGLVAVKALCATATLEPAAKGAVLVSGQVSADIVQTCVVSLVPVDQHIEEPFSVRFVPPGSADIAKPSKPGAEVVIDPNRPDPPEILTGPSIDVGAVVEECFALAIDPYPRAPDAVMPAEAGEPVSRGDSPFAALAGLGQKPHGKG